MSKRENFISLTLKNDLFFGLLLVLGLHSAKGEMTIDGMIGLIVDPKKLVLGVRCERVIARYCL